MKYGVYPYSDKQRLLVDYLIHSGRYDIRALIYPRAWKVCSEGIENLTVTSDIDDALNTVDALIILNNRQYKLTLKKMLMFIEHHKSIVCCLELEHGDYDIVIKKAAEFEVDFTYVPEKNREIEEKIDIRNDFYHSQECVVVAVGMLNSTKFEPESDLVIKIVNSFKDKGYTVSSLVSDFNLELAGFNRLLPFGLEGLIDNQDKFIMKLNSYINYVQMRDKSDLIVLQLPQENVVRMYDSLPVGFGVQIYVVSQAVDIDYFVLIAGVDINNDSGYEEISKCTSARYGFDLDTVIVYNWYLDYIESYSTFQNVCEKITEESVDECLDKLSSDKRSSIKYIRYDEKNIGDIISEDCIDSLSENIDSF